MKKLIIALTVVFISLGLVVAIVLAAIYGDIVVSGAGSSDVNKTYSPEAAVYNGKPQWSVFAAPDADYKILWGTGNKYGDPDGWWLVMWDRSGGVTNTFYYNIQDTELPPREGWQKGYHGSLPAPTLSGDGSLPVSLRSFTACPGDRGIRVSWVSESEIDHVGYILDRKSEIHNWETIASYMTHANLLGSGNTSEQKTYTVTDEQVEAGHTYSYRLSDVDINGAVTVKDVISITLEHPPEQTVLKPAFPNPFNPSTKIHYELANDTPVLLRVVDITGRHVQTIVNGIHQSAGSYSVHWNGMTDAGMEAASGVYFLLLQAGDVRQSQKMMLVR